MSGLESSSDPEGSDDELSDWGSEDSRDGDGRITACEALGESFEREAASEGTQNFYSLTTLSVY